MSLTLIPSSRNWAALPTDTIAQQGLLRALPEIMRSARWFGGKAFTIEKLDIDHLLPLDHGLCRYYLMVVSVAYADHSMEFYMLPLGLTTAPGEHTVGAWKSESEEGWIIDAAYDTNFHRALYELLLAGEKKPTAKGHFQFHCGKSVPTTEKYVSSRNPGLDQSNSSIVYNERYFMKIYRKLFRETNPEVEMLKFLTETGGYDNVPAYAGSIIWERTKIPPVTVALMMNKVDAQKDNWVTTGDELNDFLHGFMKGYFSIHEFVFENVELLARRTAEMHLALTSETSDKSFATEKFNKAYRQWLHAHVVQLLNGRLKMLDQHRDRLDDEAKAMVDKLKSKKKVIMAFFDQILTREIKSLRIRIHGDYHLGQVLYHDRDYIIIDFEGEPESAIPDRKIKHSPMKDVAGMVRSFHYAVSAKLFFSHETENTDTLRLQKAADRWFYLIRDTFWDTYYKRIGKDSGLYHNKAEINFLFLLHLLEKAIYEIGYELNGRPNWLKIPLKGIEQVVNELEKFEG
jgi:maltokinase